ncbi:papain family cysteine protease domain-containing protein [Ditylenchus destructor]|uniref:cathepsin X n=1 Tax=Ditylenchus destructor TaxID=166010 RepID=A0AAD4RAE9_9BILA|nr:papain family cysteine protease domain-containing protein [Ditylenchus destructor]
MSKIEWFYKSLLDATKSSGDNNAAKYSALFDSNKERIEHPISRPRRRNLAIGRPCLRKSGRVFEHRTYPRSYEFPGFEASLPRKWDWRNVNGLNYCSPTRNQHIPVYCGSCWVFGSLGALNDRFNVARKNRWPMTFLSPQEIIDCNGKGSCQGGEVGNVYEHAKVNGLVEEGCNNYKAVNGECDPFHRCGTCWPDKCYGIQNYTRYFIHDYGKLSGREKMMAEIHNRGPIACSIGATEQFDMHYTGGIYQEYSDTSSNHIVSVTGWGYDEETKTEYWIVRNSWGEAWVITVSSSIPFEMGTSSSDMSASTQGLSSAGHIYVNRHPSFRFCSYIRTLFGIITVAAIYWAGFNTLLSDNAVAMGLYLIFIGVPVLLLEFGKVIRMCCGTGGICCRAFSIVLHFDSWKRGLMYCLISVVCFLPDGSTSSKIAGCLLFLTGVVYTTKTCQKKKLPMYIINDPSVASGAQGSTTYNTTSTTPAPTYTS